MKKILGYSILTLLLLAALWTAAPAQLLNAITPALLQGRAWTFTALQMFSGGATISIPGILDAGTPPLTAPAAPAVATSAAIGLCTTSNTYRMYYAWSNASGLTQLSPASADIVPSTTLKKITVTRGAPPSGAAKWFVAWSSSSDAHVTKKLCAGATGVSLIEQAVSIGTYDCNCTGSTASPDSNTTTSLYGFRSQATGEFWRPHTQTVEVCKAGCLYSTVQPAIDAITDASATKKYVVLVHPGDYIQGLTLKSHVTIAGTSREVSRIFGTSIATPAINVPADTDEAGIMNITVSGGHGIEFVGLNTQRRRFYVSNATLGVPPGTQPAGAAEPIDAMKHAELAGAPVQLDVYVSGSTLRSVFDVIVGCQACRHFLAGNRYECEDTSNTADCAIYKTYATNDWQVFDTGSQAVIRFDSDNATDGHILRIAGDVGNGQPMIVKLSIDARIESSHATASAPLTCWDLPGGTQSSNPLGRLVDVSGSTCTITSASPNGTIRGFNIGTDVDLAGTAFRWVGGLLSLSGGATRWDVDSAVAATVTLKGVNHAGAYNGSAILDVDSPLLNGTHRLTPLATAPATCSIGDHYTDTSGADCACSAPNTWANTIATGTCV